MKAWVRPVSSSAAGASGAVYSGAFPFVGAAAAGISGGFGAHTFCLTVSAVRCVGRAITPPVPLEFSGLKPRTARAGRHPPHGGSESPSLVVRRSPSAGLSDRQALRDGYGQPARGESTVVVTRTASVDSDSSASK